MKLHCLIKGHGPLISDYLIENESLHYFTSHRLQNGIAFSYPKCERCGKMFIWRFRDEDWNGNKTNNFRMETLDRYRSVDDR